MDILVMLCEKPSLERSMQDWSMVHVYNVDILRDGFRDCYHIGFSNDCDNAKLKRLHNGLVIEDNTTERGSGSVEVFLRVSVVEDRKVRLRSFERNAKASSANDLLAIDKIPKAWKRHNFDRKIISKRGGVEGPDGNGSLHSSALDENGIRRSFGD